MSRAAMRAHLRWAAGWLPEGPGKSLASVRRAWDALDHIVEAEGGWSPELAAEWRHLVMFLLRDWAPAALSFGTILRDVSAQRDWYRTMHDVIDRTFARERELHATGVFFGKSLDEARGQECRGLLEWLAQEAVQPSAVA